MPVKHLRSRAALARFLRMMLCGLALLGLMPGTAEIVENIAHLLHDGHLAHSASHAIAADDEGCSPTTEHGCTPMSHHCSCCVSLAALPVLPEPFVLPAPPFALASRSAHVCAYPPDRTLDPPYYPPIDA